MDLINSNDYIGNSNPVDIKVSNKVIQISYIFYNILDLMYEGYGVYNTLNIESNDIDKHIKVLHPEFIQLCKLQNSLYSGALKVPLEAWIDFGLCFLDDPPDVKPGFNITNEDHALYITAFATVIGFLIRVGLVPKDLSNIKIVSDNLANINQANYVSFASTINTPVLGAIGDILKLDSIMQGPLFNAIRFASYSLDYILLEYPLDEQIEVAKNSQGMEYFIYSTNILILLVLIFFYVLGFLDNIRLSEINKACANLKPDDIIEYINLAQQFTIDD